MINKKIETKKLDANKIKYTSEIAISTGFNTVEKVLDYLMKKDFNNDFNNDF